jgi:hypothetical protein
MTLKTTIKAVTAYTGKSKFEFWNTIDPGDEILVEYEIKRSYYATELRLTNLAKNIKTITTTGQFNNYLYNLEYTEI